MSKRRITLTVEASPIVAEAIHEALLESKQATLTPNSIFPGYKVDLVDVGPIITSKEATD